MTSFIENCPCIWHRAFFSQNTAVGAVNIPTVNQVICPENSLKKMADAYDHSFDASNLERKEFEQAEKIAADTPEAYADAVKDSILKGSASQSQDFLFSFVNRHFLQKAYSQKKGTRQCEFTTKSGEDIHTQNLAVVHLKGQGEVDPPFPKEKVDLSQQQLPTPQQIAVSSIQDGRAVFNIFKIPTTLIEIDRTQSVSRNLFNMEAHGSDRSRDDLYFHFAVTALTSFKVVFTDSYGMERAFELSRKVQHLRTLKDLQAIDTLIS